ncbi:MAG: hypothetical protein ABWY78_06420 [Microvirga sp.]
MPCDSIITNTVDLPKMHPGLRAAALKAIGVTADKYGYFTHEGQSYQIQNGIVVGRSGQSQETVGKVADLIKRSYSAAVIKTTAARNGWALRQTGPLSYSVIKK